MKATIQTLAKFYELTYRIKISESKSVAQSRKNVARYGHLHPHQGTDWYGGYAHGKNIGVQKEFEISQFRYAFKILSAIAY